MKYFLMLLFLCVSAVPAFATQIPAEKGPQYYQKCMATPDPRLLPGSQQVFCQCTAKYMLQNMTMEDLVGMNKNERSALNKMMIGVYAPCMEVPVHDDVYQACQKQGVAAKNCQCLSNGIAKYTASEAQRLLGSVLSQYPNAFDPVAAIKQTPEFEAKLNTIAQLCGNQ